MSVIFHNEQRSKTLSSALDAAQFFRLTLVKRMRKGQRGLLPAFPFGTDLTADELHSVTALKRLKRATQHPVELVTMAVKSLWETKEAPHA